MATLRLHKRSAPLTQRAELSDTVYFANQIAKEHKRTHDLVRRSVETTDASLTRATYLDLCRIAGVSASRALMDASTVTPVRRPKVKPDTTWILPVLDTEESIFYLSMCDAANMEPEAHLSFDPIVRRMYLDGTLGAVEPNATVEAVDHAPRSNRPLSKREKGKRKALRRAEVSASRFDNVYIIYRGDVKRGTAKACEAITAHEPNAMYAYMAAINVVATSNRDRVSLIAYNVAPRAMQYDAEALKLRTL